MTDLRAADARARERALDVRVSCIVQAPAGAGKTELLTRRYLALLATVEEPESILAITFTRKAAAEMRSRILGALRGAATPDPERPLQARTLELARAALAADARHGWGLLEQPGRLRIQTIDALNLALSRRLPLLSGLGAGLGIEEDASDLYRQAAERVLLHLPNGERRHADAVATLLEHVDSRVDRFVALVVEMLGRREAWLGVLPGDVAEADEERELRTRLEATRAELVASHLESLAAAFPRPSWAEACAVARATAEHLVAGDRESPVRAWADVRGTPSPENLPVWLWQGLSQLLLTGDGTPRVRFDVRSGVPATPEGRELRRRVGLVAAAVGESSRAVELLHAVRDLPPPHYDEEEWDVLLAQFRVLRLAVAELELTFAERRLADYPRFAAAARQALGTPDEPTDTALVLDAQLRHVLVDEFQDTSETQVDLLRALTAGWQPGDGRSLFLVGDPMQSIYRFRNAEVGLFLDVRDRGLGTVALEPLTLAVNFRSTEPVIEWVNDCFSQVLPPADDFRNGAVSYSPSVAREGAGNEGGVRVYPLLRRSRLHEAEQVVDIVERRLAEDAGARIGILVQGRSHLLHVVAELVRRKVAFRATDIDPLHERPVVLDLIAMARALAHDGDRSAWLAVLHAPACGLAFADLHLICADEPHATVPELLADQERRSRLEGDARERLERAWGILDAARAEVRRHGLRDAVERAWNALGGPAALRAERELDEADAFLDVLAGIELREPGPLDLASLERGLERLYAPSRESADVRVELLTVHKAKGLEYDTVIVPALERPPGRDQRRLLRWFKMPLADRDELVVAPVARSGSEANPLYAWLERLEREKLLHERRRLLYVAATRAERWLHWFGSVQVQDAAGKAPKLRRPAAHTALGLLWPVLGSRYVERLDEIGLLLGEDVPILPRHPPLRRLPARWRPDRLPAGPTVAVRLRSTPTASPGIAFDRTGETLRHVGSVVHRELERLAREGAAGACIDPDTRSRWRDELAELGVPLERREQAVELVATAVGRTLDDERGRWLLDAAHRAQATSLAVIGRVDGEFARVVVDRTFVDRDGTRWIVDYKTSTHEGAGLEAFLDGERERYRAQLERCASLVQRLGPEPVRLGIYFPLLGGWREWRAGE